MSMETAKQVYKTRVALAALFGVQNAENIVFTQNCTHAINLVIKGLLSAGDHVVISDLEHNSVLRPIYKMSQQNGVEYSVAEVVEADDDATVQNFAAMLRPTTKLIACTHGSNAFGIKLPIMRLAALAHEHGALFLADCAQTAGVEEIDMQKMGLDFLAAPGHKSLYGPTGTGLLAINCDTPLATLTEGGTGSNSLLYEQPDFLPDRLESGTINTAGIIALEAGVAYIRRIGLAAIRAHELALAQTLYDGLQRIPGVLLYTARPTARYHLPVLSFTLEGEHSEDTALRLNQYQVATRGGFHCAPLAHKKMGTLATGTVRASIGLFNSVDDIRSFLSIIKILQNQQH